MHSLLLMIRDLEPDNWTEKVILEHPLLRGLLVEGFASEPPIIADGAKLDQLFAPADLIQVVDADYSQSVVIETVRAGRNLVVQGPPGTGKSQTIANIVAAAVHDGMTVLFVAEKMAALNVVYDRLRKVGLSDICLELHSRGANKRLVAEELDRTLKSHAIPPDAEAEAARIAEVRDYLNQVTERLHAPIGNSGLSPYRTLSLLIVASEKGITAEPDLVKEAAGWSGADFAAISETTGRLAELTETAGPRDEHPYFGVRATLLQPFELERLASELPELVRTATELADYVEQFANYLSLPSEPTLDLSS